MSKKREILETIYIYDITMIIRTRSERNKPRQPARLRSLDSSGRWPSDVVGGCCHPVYSGRQSTPFALSWAHQPGLHRRKVRTGFLFLFLHLLLLCCVRVPFVSSRGSVRPSLVRVNFPVEFVFFSVDHGSQLLSLLREEKIKYAPKKARIRPT